MKFAMSSVLKNPNCLLNRRNRNQFLVTLLINIITFSHGIGIGWMSPVMRDLQTTHSPLSFDVFVEEISWIGSVLGIGSIIGNLLAGLLQDRLGRKLIMEAVAIPHMCFWLLSYFAQSVEYLYVGRLLAGISGGLQYIVLPIFISEIADTNIRGTLGSMIMLSVNVGVLIGYIISTNVAYFMVPFFMLALPICYFICNLCFPETPHHLIRQGKFTAAEQSFRFYKNIKPIDSSAGNSEFNELKLKLTKEQALNVNSFNYKDFVTRQALKAYGMATVLLTVNQLSGLFCFSSYMADVFDASHTTLDVNMCTIVIGAVQIVGTYTATLLCDKYGRKVLLLISTLGSSLSLAAFGCYTYLAGFYDVSAVGWMPLLLLALHIFLGNIGLVGCFFVVLVELFPAKIRSVAVSFFVVCLSCMVFVALKIFPICMAHWGITATMWSCSGVCLFGFLYFCCFLEETKGKSLLDN